MHVGKQLLFYKIHLIENVLLAIVDTLSSYSLTVLKNDKMDTHVLTKTLAKRDKYLCLALCHTQQNNSHYNFFPSTYICHLILILNCILYKPVTVL